MRSTLRAVPATVPDPFSSPDGNFAAFGQILPEVVTRFETRLLAHCLMPNHVHLLLWSRGDGNLSQFVQWLTLTHTQQWHAHHHTAGSWHPYQGRFKSFPVQSDEHLVTVCRSVERNAVRAGLTGQAEDWRSGSRWGSLSFDDAPELRLSRWPIDRPTDWTLRVNTPMTPPEEEAVQRSMRRGQPYGSAPGQ